MSDFSDARSTGALNYRVETSEADFRGYIESKDGAKRMARAFDEYSRDDTPHQVRRMPAHAAHDENDQYPIIWDTKNGERAGNVVGANSQQTMGRDTVDATLSVGDADCEVVSARLGDCESRELTLRLSEDGLREFITELRLQEYDADAAEWLSQHSTADFGPLGSGGSSNVE